MEGVCCEACTTVMKVQIIENKAESFIDEVDRLVGDTAGPSGVLLRAVSRLGDFPTATLFGNKGHALK
jgi:hypothetical protein